MAVLSQIRNRPIYLIIIIGMALFAFVIGGIFQDSGSSDRLNIGTVNGEKISNERFSRLLEGQQNGNTSSLQAVKNAWDNVVREEVYKDALDKAGVVVGEKDIWDSMTSNAGIQNDDRFKDESGLFDENKLKELIATLKDNKDNRQGAAQWQEWVNYESRVKANLEQSTYNNLVKSAMVAPLKEGERVYMNENTSSDIAYAYVPYNSIKDDEVTVSDAEITAYISKHAKEFQKEATTEVEFVKFEVKPSDQDISDVKKGITTLINDYEEWNDASKSKEKVLGFKNTKNNKEFVQSNSDTPFNDKLYIAKDLPTSLFDSLLTKPVGFVYGPYRDGDYFKISKVLSKDGEESVKSSHILIAYKGATRAAETVSRTREEAEAFANKTVKEVTSANFVAKAKEFSDGPSATKGGELGFYKQGQLAKEYSEYIFDKNNSVGKIQLVETSFGFHIIKIDEKKTDAGLKLAVVSRKIDPSEQTESRIYQSAESFALDLTNGKNIQDLAKEKNETVKTANKIAELSENITGLGKQREIVKWTFDKDTQVGTIKRFDLENGDYAIAVLKNKSPKGLMSVTDAKSKVENILKKEKKSAKIHQKISGSTLEEMAKSVSKSINKANAVSITESNLKEGGKDVTLVGALLYIKENDIKRIDGNNGVFIVKVIKKNKAFEIKNFNTYTNTLTTKLKSKSNKVYDALKEHSVIEDNRTLFY